MLRIFAQRRERLDDFIHAWLERGYGERLLEKRKRGGVLAHGLIVFDASPLGIHRDLCPVETSMETSRNKARRMAYGDLCCAGEELNKPLLIGGVNREDIDQRNDAVLRGYVDHEVRSFSVEEMTVCKQFICYELPFKFLKAHEPFIESNNSYDAVSFAEANSQNAAPFIHRFVRGETFTI
jgi:hypothetical protein